MYSPIGCSIVALATLVAEHLVSQLHSLRSMSGPRSLGIGSFIGIGANASFAFPAVPCGRPRARPHSQVLPLVMSIVLVLSVSSSSPSPALYRAPPGLCGPLCLGPRGHGHYGPSVSCPSHLSLPSCPPMSAFPPSPPYPLPIFPLLSSECPPPLVSPPPLSL